MQFEKWFPIDLLKPPTHAYDLGMILYTGDENSVLVGAEVTRGGEAVTLVGTAEAYVILPDGSTTPAMEGVIDGNKVSVALTDTAMVLDGRITIALRVINGDEKTVVLGATATVRRTGTESAYDPDAVIPTWDQVQDKIAAIDEAAAQVSNHARAVVAETDADLDVVDNNGHVLLRLANGHIQTKNFDSSDVVPRKWAGKKWAAVGDSLTEVNSRTTMHYHDYIAQATGISVVNLGMSGTGYKRDYSTSAKAFYKRMDAVPTDSDIVTIFGGGNDTGKGYTLGDITDSGTSTICGCINATIDAIYQRITTVQLGIITPSPWVNMTPEDANNELAAISEAIVEICRRRSIPCLDLYHCSNLRPNDATFRAAAYSKDSGFDGVHPDETGHLLIAPRFEAFLDSLLMH